MIDLGEKDEAIKEMLKEMVETALPHIRKDVWKVLYDKTTDTMDDLYKDIAKNPLMKGFLLLILGEKAENTDLIKAGCETILNFDDINVEEFVNQIKEFRRKSRLKKGFY